MDDKRTNGISGPVGSGSPTKPIFGVANNQERSAGVRPLNQAHRHSQRIAQLLEPFVAIDPLRHRIAFVLGELPQSVQIDFFSDPHFRISLDNCEPGKGRTVFMPCLNPNGSESRCVVLKPRLATCDESFSLYIIAHELAHAFLRNGGWGEIEDREDAADALAEKWGFPRPQQSFSLWRIVSRGN
jgi:hypothetical protein